MTWDLSQEKKKVMEEIHTDFKNTLNMIRSQKDQNFQINKFLTENLNIITSIDNEQIFLYDDGYYAMDGENKLKELIQITLERENTTSRTNEIINHIKRSTYFERKEFDEVPSKFICLKNGIFNIETFKLEPHSPETMFMTQIPINFNPKARPKKILEFIRGIVPKDRKKLVYETIAYCLYRETIFQKAFMFVGTGRNGKSTLLNLINKFIGNENSTQIELQQLGENRFALAHLYGKHINFFADLPQRAIKETGRFKALTGGDYITAEEKFKKGFSFKPFAKLLFSANLVPRTDDDSDAFYRRWVIIDFPNKFEGNQDNKNLINELTTTEELEGLLFICLITLKNLLKTQSFSDYQTIEEKRALYTRLSDPVGAFIMDKIEIAPEIFIPKQELYNAFHDYCKKNQYPIVSMKSFSIAMQKNVKLEEYMASLEGTRVRCWRGIKYVVEEEDVDINKHPSHEVF